MGLQAMLAVGRLEDQGGDLARDKPHAGPLWGAGGV